MASDPRPPRFLAVAGALATLGIAAIFLLPAPGPDLPPGAATSAIPPGRRPSLPNFDLPALASGRVTKSDLAGRIALINVWASWCGPCREELPALDSLQRVLTAPDFAFLALSDDVSEPAARSFAAEHGFTFPIGLGGGGLKRRFRYWGLPTTLLVDADGRLMRTWLGYGGPPQLDAITALIAEERARTRP